MGACVSQLLLLIQKLKAVKTSVRWKKLFPLYWQAHCFPMRQQKLANFGRRELNLYDFFCYLKKRHFL